MESVKMNYTNEKDVCAICMESLPFNRRILHTTECGHTFHACCFGKINEPVCPCCRSKVTHEIRRQSKEIRKRLHDLRLEEHNILYDQFHSELKWMNQRMEKYQQDMKELCELRQHTIEKINQKYQYYKLLRKTLQGQLTRINLDIRMGLNIRKISEISKNIENNMEVYDVTENEVRMNVDTSESEEADPSLYISDVMVDDTENVDDSNISINDRSQDMVDNSNLYQAEGLDESGLFQDMEVVFESNLSPYNERSEEDDVVLMSQEIEGFTEGRLVVSEENLETTYDGVGRSMESDSNIVPENDEMEFLSFLFSKMEIDQDEFIEHYDGYRNLREGSLQLLSLRYSQMELEEV
jgi:hypothetical protein